VQVSLDVSAAGISTRSGASGTLGFTAARKFVSQATITAYEAVGVSIVDLDGVPVTRAGWYDFTARDRNQDGIYDTDGAIFVDFQSPGQPGYGTVDAIVVVLTDNAFGDDDPTLERIVDPILPGSANAAPSIAAVTVPYVNSPLFDTFAQSAGRLAAIDMDGDALTYGIAGVRKTGVTQTAVSGLGSLQVNSRTGQWTFTPNLRAINAVSGSTIATFTTTVSDGKLVSSSVLNIRVTPSAVLGVTGDFLISSTANVITRIPAKALGGPDVTGPVVPVQQAYLEFTLRGLAGEITHGDLRLYANDRLISLRGTRLVRVGQSAGATTYRLFGIEHVSSARARYVFAIGGHGGWISATWQRR
jgi:hypothetical protein